MNKTLRVIELFAGIGAPRKALIRGGIIFKLLIRLKLTPNQ